MWNNIYSGNDVIIDEIIENEILSLRISYFESFHYQGERIIAPQLSSLTFEKKYNKINKQNYFDWFLVKSYDDFEIYLSQNEKYIMICNEIDGKVLHTNVYNIKEITTDD